VYLIGETVPEPIITEWKKKIQENESLLGSKLSIRQGQDKISELKTEMSKVKEGLLKDFTSQELNDKETEILILNDKIKHLEKEIEAQKSKVKVIPLLSLSNEAKINYPNIESISFAEVITSNFKQIDTLPVISAKWNKKTRLSTIKKEKEKLGEWFKYKLELDTIIVNQVSK